MKKIISMLTLVAIIVTMCSFTVFADYASTLTMLSNDADNKLNTGEEVIVTVKVGTTNGMKTLGFAISFDPDDIEVGTSDAADAAAEEYKDFIGTTDFPTLDSVCITVLSRPSYVDDGYFTTYSSYTTAQQLGGLPGMGYEERNGYGNALFGYQGTGSAKNALNKVDNMLVGGAVLKVKTAEKKQTTITIQEATASGADGVDTPCTIANTITLDLNGYVAGESGGDEGSTTGDEVFETPTVTKPTESIAGKDPKTGKPVTLELGENAKQIAVFGKNPASKNLAAGEYGIIVGGKTFPGAAEVKEGQYWCIQLVTPTGYLKDGTTSFAGTYSVQSYVGEARGTATTVTVQ